MSEHHGSATPRITRTETLGNRMRASRRSRSGLAVVACAVLAAASLVAPGAAGAVAAGVVSYVDTAQSGE